MLDLCTPDALRLAEVVSGLHEGSIQKAVARWINPWRNVVVPNFCYFHEMDVAVLTKAGCLWEFEIKVSQSDWNRDRLKDVKPEAPEWLGQVYSGDRLAKHVDYYTRPRRDLDRAHVKRFTYVYARGLKAPDWVPAWAGLMEAWLDVSRVRLESVKEPTDRSVEKPAESVRRAMLESIYYRYYRYGQHVEPEEATDEAVAV